MAIADTTHGTQGQHLMSQMPEKMPDMALAFPRCRRAYLWCVSALWGNRQRFYAPFGIPKVRSGGVLEWPWVQRHGELVAPELECHGI